MNQKFENSNKTQVMYEAMEPDVQASLEKCIAILKKKAKAEPAIDNMLDLPKPIDYSDIPIDLNWSFEEHEENFRLFEE